MDHEGLLPNSTIEKDEHDPLFNAKRVVPAGDDDQKPWDDTTTANVVYLGRGARGLATSSDGWVIREVNLTNKTSKCAIGAWDNRASLTYE